MFVFFMSCEWIKRDAGPRGALNRAFSGEPSPHSCLLNTIVDSTRIEFEANHCG
jgi:hypothetical protein